MDANITAENCIFCKIVEGGIPAHKVYEDTLAVAFLDIHPHAKGHVQVIPKDHHRWVWDIPEIGKFYEAVQKVVLAQRKAFSTDWIISHVVGDEVPHAHVWLIPAHKGNPDRTYVYKEGEMEMVAEKIRSALSS